MEKVTGTRALVYVRQSVTREESVSLELQEAACRTYAAQRGYSVVRVESDPGISGLKFAKRPGIRRALEAVETGEVDVIVCWRWSRLSRKRTDQAVILDRIETAGGRTESALEPLDTTTAGGRFSREVLLAMAAFTSEQTSEQWQEAHQRRLSLGLPPQGRKQYGYTREYAVLEPEASVLRRMYREYTAGRGFRLIADGLNSEGIPSPLDSVWRSTNIRSILERGFARGYFTYKGVEYKGDYPALITDDEWLAYQAARKRNAFVPRKSQTVRWYLQGLVLCGTCGSKMTSIPIYQDGKPNGNRSLCCALRRAGGKSACSGQNLAMKTVESSVWYFLVAYMDQWQAALPTGEREDAQTALTAAEQRLLEVETALAKLASGWATGLVDDAGYSGARVSLLEAQKAAQGALETARVRMGEVVAPIDYSAALIDPHGTDPLPEPGEWNRAISRVIRSIKVEADRSLTVEITDGNTYRVAVKR